MDDSTAIKSLVSAAKRGINEYLASVPGAALFGPHGRLEQAGSRTLLVKTSYGDEFSINVVYWGKPKVDPRKKGG